ncbi:hypothetical protein ACSBR2_036997 [Camellia fascicularis]
MVTCTENSIEEEEHAFVQLQEELKNVGSSIDTLNTNLEQLNQRKANCLNKMQHLQERISGEGTTDVVQRLLSLSQSLKALEMQESEHKSNCNAKYSKLQAEVNELENIISCGNDDTNLSHGINHSLYNSLERLNSAKRELAVKLREIVLLKRQLDDVPSQEELIQYEHRFSELYVHIQEKLRQTRELYATFNAMLEIKDLMLKETSLLNSISSQKLEKVQLALEAERNARDAVKQRYAAAIVEQRSCYSLLKAFQEECTKNERLRSLSSEILP